MKGQKEYTISNRRLICENSQFELFFDHVKTREGFNVSDYLVVAPKRKADNINIGVAVLPIIDGEYALIKVYRHAIQDYSWEIPNGFVDDGEKSIESAKRELEEEPGLYCEKDNILPLGFVTSDAGILAARMNLFVATQCRRIKPYAANEMGIVE